MCFLSFNLFYKVCIFIKGITCLYITNPLILINDLIVLGVFRVYKTHKSYRVLLNVKFLNNAPRKFFIFNNEKQCQSNIKKV